MIICTTEIRSVLFQKEEILVLFYALSWSDDVGNVHRVRGDERAGWGYVSKCLGGVGAFTRADRILRLGSVNWEMFWDRRRRRGWGWECNMLMNGCEEEYQASGDVLFNVRQVN